MSQFAPSRNVICARICLRFLSARKGNSLATAPATELPSDRKQMANPPEDGASVQLLRDQELGSGAYGKVFKVRYRGSVAMCC